VEVSPFYKCYEFPRTEYEHPLVVGNVRRKASTLGVEVKIVNDWTQFVEDKEVQGILFSPD
jgi:hypothetical protein